MANKSNILRSAVAASILFPILCSQVSSAPIARQEIGNTVFDLSLVGQRASTYLPQPVAFMASFVLVGLKTAFASQPSRQWGSGIAMLATKRADVIDIAFKPDAPLPSSRMAAPTPSNSAAFDSVTIPFKRLSALKKLSPALEEMENGTAVRCGGKGCSPAFATIQLAAAGSAQSSVRDKLNAVNAAVNQSIRYRTDQDAYKVADRWSTPRETLATQQGDCEDFAILKMAALRAEGIDPDQMSIVVLFDQKRHFYHAVLSVEVNGKFFILDNMRNQVLLDTQLPDYKPLYSIKDGKGFLHGSRRKEQKVALATPLENVAPGEGTGF